MTWKTGISEPQADKLVYLCKQLPEKNAESTVRKRILTLNVWVGRSAKATSIDRVF